MGRSTKAAAAVAGIALLLAGGGAYALASSGGRAITVCVKHQGGALYKAKKCAKHDKKLSWNKQGPQGQQGPQGVQGPKGDTGAQGPGGSTITYDANASATPTMTPLGTVLGDTLFGECGLVAGHVDTELLIQTTDGSLKMDFANSMSSGNVVVSRFNVPAGTLSTPTLVDDARSPNVDTQLQETQIGPSPGGMTWHLSADDGTQTCHGSIISFPTTVAAVGASTAASSARTHLPLTTTRP
ncbi:MAG TPA: hypothetical protein VJU80_03330 [Solirubrobacteraceae bacterium]|nr:hypothetical protein [Solirubrobacteraceae bacterium]